MSLQPSTEFDIPEETRRVACAAFPRGTLCLKIAETLGGLYRDEDFADLFPRCGQPAASPARLAWVTVLQFVENLSDRAAADAVRGRLDWKYLLGLELTDPGFDHTVLSEFRARLTEHGAERRLLEALLSRLRDLHLLNGGGRQRTDSTHILAAVRTLNRLERVGETLRAALNAVAEVAPEWLQQLAPPKWYERYARRVENDRLPAGKGEREQLATEIGADGQAVLDAIAAASPSLAALPEVETLRQVWEQQYRRGEDGLVWRSGAELSAIAARIESPYDPQARDSTKRSVDWVGYKVHLTETCDTDAPRVLTDVRTTDATVPDTNVLPDVHRALASIGLLPAEHVVDQGYTSPQLILDSRRDGVRLVGPLPVDTGWQARAGKGFDKAHFLIDWEAQEAICPAGCRSRAWKPKTGVPGMETQVRFSPRDCRPCPHREDCTHSKGCARVVLLQSRACHEALREARELQTTEAFEQAYAARAGVESTHAQAIRRSGLRACRYIGLAKTGLQHVATAVALNLIRVCEWLNGTPVAPTRRSRFALLQQAA